MGSRGCADYDAAPKVATAGGILSLGAPDMRRPHPGGLTTSTRYRRMQRCETLTLRLTLRSYLRWYPPRVPCLCSSPCPELNLHATRTISFLPAPAHHLMTQGATCW